jgi:hypothetical protein
MSEANELEQIRARHEACGHVDQWPDYDSFMAHTDRATLLNLLDAAREELRQKGDGWQDISTAPKDGTPVIGLRFPASDNPTMCGAAFFNGHNWVWLGAHYLEPTHWIPFSKPPAAPTRAQGEKP